MRLNAKRKLQIIDSITEDLPDYQTEQLKQELDIKPRMIEVQQKQLKFLELASDRMAKKGLGNEEKAGLKRKQSLANQMTETISSFQINNEEDLLVKVAIPSRARGKSGRILDGTELIKEMVKQQKIENKPLEQAPKSQKKSRKKSFRHTRQDLAKSLKKCQLKKKSSTLTAQQLKETFQKTNLQDMKNYKKASSQDKEQDNSKSINQLKNSKAKMETIEAGKNIKHYNDQSSKYSSDVDQSLSCSILVDESNSHISSSVIEPKHQKTKYNKLKQKSAKCQYLEYEAEQSGSDISEGRQSSDDEDDDVKDLIDNNVKLNLKHQEQAMVKRLEMQAADDQIIMQKIKKGEFFRKKSIPALQKSEKIKQMRAQQEKKKCSEIVNDLFKSTKIVQQNVLAQAPHTPAIIDLYQEQKQVFKNQQFFQNNRKKSAICHIPQFLVKKQLSQSRSKESQEQQIKMLQKKKRGSLINPRTRVSRTQSSALQKRINKSKLFPDKEGNQTEE